MALGIGYMPAERKTEGLFLELSLGDNIASASLQKFSAGHFTADLSGVEVGDSQMH
jgi:ABC-type sugar transport system ATPase subunit